MQRLLDVVDRWWWVPVGGVLAAVVWWLAGEGNSDQVIAVLTLALVATTIVYVAHTKRIVVEMRESRTQDLELWRREKSERAAARCLEVLLELDTAMSRVGAGVDREKFWDASRTLRGHAPLITDDGELKDHLQACAEVAYVASFDEAAMDTEQLSPGRVQLNARQVIRATRSALLSYLAGEERGEWHWDAGSSPSGERELLPSATNAFSWIRTRSKVGKP